MIQDQWFKPVHAFLVGRRQLITNVFGVIEYGLVVAIAGGYYFFVSQPSAFELIDTIGRQAGQVAAVCYAITLFAGILKRLDILPLIRVSLRLFRRHVGIISFLLMVMHSFFLYFFSYIEQWRLPLLDQRQFYGFIGLWLLVPLWLTSNDWSERILGKLWQLIHKLTYIALFFVFLHVALVSQKLGILLFTTFFLVIISWLVFWLRRLRQSGQNQVTSSR